LTSTGGDKKKKYGGKDKKPRVCETMETPKACDEKHNRRKAEK